MAVLPSGRGAGLPFPLWQRLVLHLPQALAACALGLGVLAIPAWRLHWWPRSQRWHYTTLATAPAILNAIHHLSGGQVRQIPATPGRALAAIAQAPQIRS